MQAMAVIAVVACVSMLCMDFTKTGASMIECNDDVCLPEFYYNTTNFILINFAHADITGDNVADAIATGLTAASGECNNASLIYFTKETGTWQKKNINNSMICQGFGSVYAGDGDGDGRNEVFAFHSGDAAHSSANYLRMFYSDDGGDTWDYDVINESFADGGVVIMELADVDLDGNKELVMGFGSLSQSSDLAALWVYEYSGGIWQLAAVANVTGDNGVYALDTGQLDDDPAVEIVVGTDDGVGYPELGGADETGYIATYEYNGTLNLDTVINETAGKTVLNLYIGDFDHDHENELVDYIGGDGFAGLQVYDRNSAGEWENNYWYDDSCSGGEGCAGRLSPVVYGDVDNR